MYYAHSFVTILLLFKFIREAEVIKHCIVYISERLLPSYLHVPSCSMKSRPKKFDLRRIKNTNAILSSSSSPKGSFDVFLSFCGQDTCMNFVLSP